jgi:hypothetical protein
VVFGFWSTIGDVRKCTDEEHITYNGGSKIKDLAQCGWGEKKMKRKENEKIKCQNSEIIKIVYLENNEMLLKVIMKVLWFYNNIYKYFMIKSAPISLKLE